MLPCENEIHARFCSAHAAPRWLPDERNEPSASDTNRSASASSPRKRWVMPSPRNTLAAPDSSSISRQSCNAWPKVSSATSYAPVAASPSPSSVSAFASPARSSASRASASASSASVARRVEIASLHAGPGPAEQRGAVLGGVLATEQTQGAVVMPFGRRPRLDRLVAFGGAA